MYKLTEIGLQRSIDDAVQSKLSYINELRGDGQWVVVRAIVSEPAPNPLNDAAKLRDAGDVRRFVGVEVSGGASLGEALRPPDTTSAQQGQRSESPAEDGRHLRAIEVARYAPYGADSGPAGELTGSWKGGEGNDRLSLFPGSAADPTSITVGLQLAGMTQPVTASTARLDETGTRIQATFEADAHRLDVTLVRQADGTLEGTIRSGGTPDTRLTFHRE
jgi:hypothetical protein